MYQTSLTPSQLSKQCLTFTSFCKEAKGEYSLFSANYHFIVWVTDVLLSLQIATTHPNPGVTGGNKGSSPSHQWLVLYNWHLYLPSTLFASSFISTLQILDCHYHLFIKSSLPSHPQVATSCAFIFLMHIFFLYIVDLQNFPFIQHIPFGKNLALTNSSNITCKDSTYISQTPGLLECIARCSSTSQTFLNSVPWPQPMTLSRYI